MNNGGIGASSSTEVQVDIGNIDANTDELEAFIGTNVPDGSVNEQLKDLKTRVGGINDEGSAQFGTQTQQLKYLAEQLLTLVTNVGSDLATETTLATRASEATLVTRASEATLATRASEATLASLEAKDFATEATLATRATETTLATRASEATLASLEAKDFATETTLATRATEATLATRATEATLATRATEAKQDTQITRLGTNGDASDVDGTQAGQLRYIGEAQDTQITRAHGGTGSSSVHVVTSTGAQAFTFHGIQVIDAVTLGANFTPSNSSSTITAGTVLQPGYHPISGVVSTNEINFSAIGLAYLMGA